MVLKLSLKLSLLWHFSTLEVQGMRHGWGALDKIIAPHSQNVETVLNGDKATKIMAWHEFGHGLRGGKNKRGSVGCAYRPVSTLFLTLESKLCND
jgi:hypothetical protein